MRSRIERLVQRSQRGIKIKDGDMFVRSNRLYVVVSSDGGDMRVLDVGTGVQSDTTSSAFKSRHIQRIKVSDPSLESRIGMAKEVAASKTLSAESKSSVLRALSRASSGEEKEGVQDLLRLVVSRGRDD